MEPFRRNRFEMLAQFAGGRFSWSAAPKPVPLNLLYLAANIYLRQLCPKAPRSLITSRDQGLLPVAKDMQAWSDRAAQGMRLRETLQAVGMNALTGPFGMAKVGVEHVDDIHTADSTIPVGQPFCKPVDPDDAVVDMTAARIECCRYQGNRYSVPLEEAKEDQSFDKSARENLQAAPNRIYNEMGDSRVTTLSQGTMAQFDDDFEDAVELWDLYLPKEKLLITAPYQDSAQGGSLVGDKPLKVVDWTGRPEGPYHFLSLCDLPNSIMSPAPLQSLVEMHDALNVLWRKILRQAKRHKRNIGFGGAAAEDVEAYNRANDGEAFKTNHPDLIKEMSTGGIDPAMFQFVEQMRQIFSWLAGNLDTQGGLSPQAGTLGQEELLSKSSSMQIAEMQDRMWNFSAELWRDVNRHWWESPVLYYEAVRQTASGDMIPVSITPQMRQMPFDRLSFEIDMYSMQHETPATRLSGFLSILQQTIMPLMPMLGQQGYSLKGEAILEVIGRYGNYPDLSGILVKGPPPEMQGSQAVAQGAIQHEQTKPPQTTRTQIRRSAPAMTDRGNSQQLQQMLGKQIQQGMRNGANQ